MSSKCDRSWSLSPRRRWIVIIASVGGGFLALVVAGATLGWSDLGDVIAIVCVVTGGVLLLTTLTVPKIDDRSDWKNPVRRLDGRTKRRALRCIRHGDVGGAPAGLDLEAFAFHWGRLQARSLRMSLPLGLIVFGGLLTETDLWMQLLRIAFVITTVVVAVYAFRDLQLCQRFLDAASSGESGAAS
ncbi:MAG TPA: hypothetical protein VIP98_06570 [Microlunatus sp.]